MLNYMALGINKKRGGSKLKVLVPLLVDQAPLVRGTIATAHNSASVGLKPYAGGYDIAPTVRYSKRGHIILIHPLYRIFKQMLFQHRIVQFHRRRCCRLKFSSQHFYNSFLCECVDAVGIDLSWDDSFVDLQ